MKSWFTDYKDSLSTVAAQVAERIQAFPEPLASAGSEYWRAYNPLEQGSTKNYICYLLPLWTNESCNLSEDKVERLTTSCIFAMLYFFLLDDRADRQPTDKLSAISPAHAVALTALFHDEMMRLFQSEFPADSLFWTLYRRYLSEWAIAVATEQEQRLPYGSISEPAEAFNFANKSAPVKLAAACIAIAAGKEHWIPSFEAAINRILLTLQMMDDWMDWEEDWEQGSNSNMLIIHLNQRYHASLPIDQPRAPLDRKQLEDELYLKSGLRSFATIASDAHQSLLENSISEPELEKTIMHVHSFHETLTKQLNDVANQIEQNKLSLMHGGIFNFLSK
ncbi:conserved hypothetical protein [Paenibacillus curdlanolyticus YK9]|uniref:Polyprenyl synthetase n=1 Tax=Paenibacillus curdlanolyticus YK9 TaxID=717606 RepID=E0IAM1_9BACL|nr:hypothetical protein [Paenibacillus curdlanolyticus]EFM10425.1 conserved hypothetical protein [Paenibacillus curdlanolyticus YK9]